ncbi:MAG: ATP-binding protein [Endomicrobia bacterium]|nr:ATP-binding protein [Endomicrobiia bacterium]
MKDFEKLAEQEKMRIERIREKIKSLTEQIQQKKEGISTQLLNIKPQLDVSSGSTVSPSLFSEIQNMLLETITKGYETIISEKEKIIERLRKEIDIAMEKYQQLKLTQEQQIARVSALSEQQDKSVLELVKKSAELEAENKILKNKINELQLQSDKLATSIKYDRVQYVLSHIRVLTDTMKECLRYFRNPFGMINEALELVKKDVDVHPACRKVELIQQEMTKIHNVMLAVIERLKFSENINLQKVDLRNVISIVIGKFQQEFANSNVEVSQQVNTSNVFVTADVQILIDCVSEIISNSIESFLQPIGNRIILRIEDNSGVPKLIVEDNGCGIPEHLLPKVFNLFFTTKFERGHYGIGLFKVHWCMKMFNAKVMVSSTYNKGTTVVIEFSE